MKISIHKRAKGFSIGHFTKGGTWYEFDIGWHFIRIEMMAD